MIVAMTRRTALLGISTFLAMPLRAEPANKSKPKTDAPDLAVLENPAAFDINAVSGSLKETVQKGQQLVWRGKDDGSEGRFQFTNISIAFLRSETGGQLKITFACNISSLGYLAADDVKLNMIVRSKGGAALHSWSFGIAVKCTDKDKPLTPLTQEVPTDIAANVFTNVAGVEVAELTEPGYAGVKTQACAR
jgi:hypothetical protein